MCCGDCDHALARWTLYPQGELILKRKSIEPAIQRLQRQLAALDLQQRELEETPSQNHSEASFVLYGEDYPPLRFFFAGVTIGGSNSVEVTFMQYFMDTNETIAAGVGFALFGPLHLIELGLCVLLTLLCALRYRRAGETARRNLRVTFAVLLILDEVFKHAMLLLGGRWLPAYLPLHLCSINVFLVAFHAWNPSKAVSDFLYCICLPAAVAALLFPNWSSLPLGNFMHLHSLSIHFLLAAYPVMLLAGGEVRRNPRQIPRCLLILLALAAVALAANLVLDTNFMFLMRAPENSPLTWFETALGNHLLGFPIIITAVLFVMYLPLPKRRTAISK